MTDNLDPAAEKTGATASTALTLQQHAMQELDTVAAGIDALQKKYAGVVYDVTTTKGMAEAKAARKEIRDVRYAVENTRKDKGAELKRIASAINDRASEITDPIRALEDPIDAQIKAEEDRKEAERAERQRQEQERIAAMNARLDNIRNMPLHAVGATAEEIQQAVTKLEDDALEGFDDVYLPTAQQTKDAALATLTKLLDERRQLDEQAAEMERQRQEQAARDAEAAEQRRKDDEAAQAERDRQAAEQRERQEREDTERKAQQLVDEHIADLKAIPTGLIGKPASVISDTIAEVEQIDPAHSRFGTRRVEADAAKVATLTHLRTMLASAEAQERQQAEMDEQRRQLEEQQAAQREAEAKAEQERQEAAQRDEAERLAREKAEAEEREQARARAAAEAERRAGMLFIVNAPDGSRWAVPVMTIARDRAKHYASEFDGDVERSLDEDTMPLFEADPYNVQDWAVNNMNWADVKDHARIYAPAKPITDEDMQEAWMEGAKEVVMPAKAVKS